MNNSLNITCTDGKSVGYRGSSEESGICAYHAVLHDGFLDVINVLGHPVYKGLIPPRLVARFNWENVLSYEEREWTGAF